MSRWRTLAALSLALTTGLACRSTEPVQSTEAESREPEAAGLHAPRGRSVPPPADVTRLSGRVTDFTGAPIAGCEVRVRYLDPMESHFPPSAFSMADGRYVLEGVKPGHVELWVWDQRFGESEPLHIHTSRGERRSGLELGF